MEDEEADGNGEEVGSGCCLQRLCSGGDGMLDFRKRIGNFFFFLNKT